MRVLPTTFRGEVVNVTVQEMPFQWYDMIYRDERMYSLPACESLMYPVYKRVAECLGAREKVLDLGCGTGQLSHLLNGRYALGVDFSPVAVEKAKSLNPVGKFFLADLYKPSTYELADYDCVVLCEVMEHLEHDLAVLGFIKSGMHIVFTVPNYITYSHVRGFVDEEHIRERYEAMLDIRSISYELMDRVENWKVWVIDSIRR